MSDAPQGDTPTTPPEAPQTPPEAPETPATGDSDLTAEVEKWKAQARKHEDRAKANAAAAKELEKLRTEALPEQERLVAEAEARGTAAATARLAAKLVDAEVKVAAGGRVDVDALLEGMDRSRFMTDEGEPDSAAIAAWVDRIAPAPAEEHTEDPHPFPDLGQGARPDLALGSDPLLASLKSTLGIR